MKDVPSVLNLLIYYSRPAQTLCPLQWRIQDFPQGRGPVEGRGPPTWALLVKMFAKTKELGPVGRREPGTPPRSANAIFSLNIPDSVVFFHTRV